MTLTTNNPKQEIIDLSDSPAHERTIPSVINSSTIRPVHIPQALEARKASIVRDERPKKRAHMGTNTAVSGKILSILGKIVQIITVQTYDQWNEDMGRYIKQHTNWNRLGPSKED